MDDSAAILMIWTVSKTLAEGGNLTNCGDKHTDIGRLHRLKGFGTSEVGSLETSIFLAAVSSHSNG